MTGGILGTSLLVSTSTLFLEFSWWQGVAGIAQIIAALLTIIIIFQAKKGSKQATETIKIAKETIILAEESRKASVRPDIVYSINGPIQQDPINHKYSYILYFKNVGFGPLIKPKPSFISMENPARIIISPIGDYADEQILIIIHTENQTTTIKGFLLIECLSRYGESIKWKFKVTLDFISVTDVNLVEE